MSWATDVTDGLVELKQAGMPFESSWALMMDRYGTAIPARAFGSLRPDVDERSEVELLRWACQEEWEGRPVCGELQAVREIVEGLTDHSTRAQAKGRARGHRLYSRLHVVA